MHTHMCMHTCIHPQESVYTFIPEKLWIINRDGFGLKGLFCPVNYMSYKELFCLIDNLIGQPDLKYFRSQINSIGYGELTCKSQNVSE